MIGKDYAFKSQEEVTALYDITEDSITSCFIMVILSISPRVISELRGY